MADCLAKASAKADNLITAVRTVRLLDVEIHPNCRTLTEQKGFLIYMVQDIYAHKGKGCFFLKDLKVSLAPTPRKKTIHVMFVETNHTQDKKKQKVSDWNHLSSSVAVSAKPTSKRGRGSELTQPHFCGTDENV